MTARTSVRPRPALPRAAHLLFALLAGAALLARPARGAEPGAPAASPRLSLLFGVDRQHDDNVLQLTRRGFDRFAADPAPPRFRITSPEDDITFLRGDLRWRARPVRRRETRVDASGDIALYQHDTVKDWQQYRLGVRQELTASRRHLTTLELSVSALPSYYLGEITDEDASFAAGRRIRRSLRYAQTRWAAALEHQALRGRLVLDAGVERATRDYDTAFDERDGHDDAWTVAAEVRPFRRWGGAARVRVETGAYEARGDLATSPIRDADISYRHRGVGAGVTLPWGHGASRGRLDAAWMPERRTYTTGDKFDLTRYGRVNQRHEVTLRATQRVWGPLEAVLSWVRLTSDASFTQGLALDPDLTDFDQTRTGVMLRARWELPTR